MARPLDDYVTVDQRITAFFEKYPDGSLSCRQVKIFSAAGSDYILYQAEAYRQPEDKLPGVGTAWELVPGPTPFTQGSEAQNAETSAWGRAIVAVGAADAHKGIATRNDVANAREVENLIETAPDEWRATFSNRCKALANEMGMEPGDLERSIVQQVTKGRTNDPARIKTGQIPMVMAALHAKKVGWRKLQEMSEA